MQQSNNRIVRLGDTLQLRQPPYIAGFASVVGKKEGDGLLGAQFDVITEDAHMGQKTWEQAEAKMQQVALETAAHKAGCNVSGMQLLLAGDLLNQCMASSMASMHSNLPFLGLFGACSTMAEGVAVGALLLAGGGFTLLAAAASSHFCTAERQFRFPLAYGGQRPPTAQWTATAAGAVVLQQEQIAVPHPVRITHVHVGRMVELGVTDAGNMGAAMAPAACETLTRLLRDTHTKPNDYDRILTGDLADVGSALLVQLMAREGIDITPSYGDCGSLLYGDDQDTHAGGSGCGCSAAVLCSEIMHKMQAGIWKRVIFAGTGALMSPTTAQQGQAIIGICHAVVLES